MFKWTKGVLMDPYEHHKKVYDIIDRAYFLRTMMSNYSKVIDESYQLPNSLQALLGMIYRYEGSTQSELAVIYKRDEKNIIHYVSDLVKRNLVYKVKEGQKKKLYLTEEGQIINNHLMIKRGELIDDILDIVDNEHLAITRDTLDQIINLLIEKIDSAE